MHICLIGVNFELRQREEHMIGAKYEVLVNKTCIGTISQELMKGMPEKEILQGKITVKDFFSNLSIGMVAETPCFFFDSYSGTPYVDDSIPDGDPKKYKKDLNLLFVQKDGERKNNIDFRTPHDELVFCYEYEDFYAILFGNGAFVTVNGVTYHREAIDYPLQEIQDENLESYCKNLGFDKVPEKMFYQIEEKKIYKVPQAKK